MKRLILPALALGSRVELVMLENEAKTFSTKANSTLFQAEAQFYLGGIAMRESYLLCGAGFHTTNRETVTRFVTATDTAFSFAYSFGAGYRGEHLVVEARYLGLTMPEWKYSGRTWDKAMTANGINLTLGFQF